MGVSRLAGMDGFMSVEVTSNAPEVLARLDRFYMEFPAQVRLLVNAEAVLIAKDIELNLKKQLDPAMHRYAGTGPAFKTNPLMADQTVFRSGTHMHTADTVKVDADPLRPGVMVIHAGGGLPYLDEGSRPHTITAKWADFLHLQPPSRAGIEFAKSVQHPGVAARHYVEKAIIAANVEARLASLIGPFSAVMRADLGIAAYPGLFPGGVKGVALHPYGIRSLETGRFMSRASFAGLLGEV